MQEATYVFRPAANGSESERAAHYFLEHPPGEVRWFVAVRRRPVERVVGSVGWWLKLDAGGYARAEFDWYLEGRGARRGGDTSHTASGRKMAG